MAVGGDFQANAPLPPTTLPRARSLGETTFLSWVLAQDQAFEACREVLQSWADAIAQPVQNAVWVGAADASSMAGGRPLPPLPLALQPLQQAAQHAAEAQHAAQHGAQQPPMDAAQQAAAGVAIMTAAMGMLRGLGMSSADAGQYDLATGLQFGQYGGPAAAEQQEQQQQLQQRTRPMCATITGSQAQHQQGKGKGGAAGGRTA